MIEGTQDGHRSGEDVRFESGRALADLPWFEERDDGRIAVASDEVGPVIDVHTHLALAFLRRMPFDLGGAPGPTRHYLPLADPWDLDVYANRNFTPASLSAMKRDLGIGGISSGGEYRTTHTAPNLLAEMDPLGITCSIILAIDMPWLSWNSESYLAVAAREPRLPAMASVHPHVRDAGARLERMKAAGAIGIKVHPAVQLVAPDHPKAMALYRLCADLALPVLWHCGPVGIELAVGRKLCQLKHYWKAVHDNPDTTFVLGHSGALQMEMGLHLAKSYRNVYLEIASQSVSHVRRILTEGPPERILFGSDWPYYHQVLPLAKVMLASRDRPRERSLLLHENAARLFGLA